MRRLSFEAPGDATAKAKPVLEKVECVPQRRPEIHLVELRRVEILSIEDLSIGVQELAEVRVNRYARKDFSTQAAYVRGRRPRLVCTLGRDSELDCPIEILDSACLRSFVT
jgi:hypothetical protein